MSRARGVHNAGRSVLKVLSRRSGPQIGFQTPSWRVDAGWGAARQPWWPQAFGWEGRSATDSGTPVSVGALVTDAAGRFPERLRRVDARHAMRRRQGRQHVLLLGAQRLPTRRGARRPRQSVSQPARQQQCSLRACSGRAQGLRGEVSPLLARSPPWPVRPLAAGRTEGRTALPAHSRELRCSGKTHLAARLRLSAQPGIAARANDSPSPDSSRACTSRARAPPSRLLPP